MVEKITLIFFFAVPPSEITFIGQSVGSRIPIKENEELELQCKVANAKPKANIMWYRRGSLFNPGRSYKLIDWNFPVLPFI